MIKYWIEALIYNWKLKIEFLNFFGFGPWIWKYVHAIKVQGKREKYLLEFIYKIAEKVAEKENVPIFVLPIEELNKDEKDTKRWSAGVYFHLKKECNKIEREEKIRQLIEIYKLETLPRELINPRIELGYEKGEKIEENCWTLIHELGHHFVEKKGEEQSEEKADKYIEEFFDTYLPPFFKWAFQIMLGIRIMGDKWEVGGRYFKFSRWESFLYYKDLIEFTDNK
jgi:hypothetical protein